jgi:polyisoprenoid-binding protein YceI
MPPRRAAVLLILLLAGFSSPAQERMTFSLDPGRSKVEIAVYKAGFFRAFGHNHTIAAKIISGQVHLDPKTMKNSSVSLKMETASLTVVDPGESEKDRREVQATMAGEEVLNVAKYPEIIFTSTDVSATKQTADGWQLDLSGKLSLHGAEKTIRFPLHLLKEGNELRARGEVPLLQTDYGITPVKVGGGAVKVKNQVKISFDIVATRSKE